MTGSRFSRLAGVAAVAMLVAACTSSGASNTPAPASNPPAATQAAATQAAQTKAPAKTYTYADLHVGFIQTGSESGWRSANTASFKETAQQKGIDLHFYDAQNKIENQVSAFHQFNNDPTINVIILAALDVKGYDDVLNEAKQKGKLVVLEDRRIDADPGMYYTYIGSDFINEGHEVADTMCTLLKDSAKKNVVEISGAVGASAAIDRAKGFREKMGDCGITITATQTGDWDVAKSKAVMEAFLKQSKDIQGVFGHNDEEAIGAIQAIQEAGLKPGVDIKVIGVDATAHGFQALIDGTMNADIECNPLLAPQVYEAALKGLNGDTSVPKWVPSNEGAFYASQGAAALQEILKTRKY